MGRRADHARRYRARFRLHAGFILAHAGFAALFVTLVLSAFHAPSPHDLPVGIVAPAAVTGQVEDALSTGAQSPFELHVYRSPALARAAIAHRQVDGALIASPVGLHVLVAEGGGHRPGPGPDPRVRHPGRPVRGAPRSPTWRRRWPGDTQALSPFFIILGVLIPSLAAGLGVRPGCSAGPARPGAWPRPSSWPPCIGVGRGRRRRRRVRPGHFAAIAGLVALFSLAVSAPTAALGRLWPPLVSVGGAGVPGARHAGQRRARQPGPLHPGVPAPPAARAAARRAADAVRNAVYFGGYGTTGTAGCWPRGPWPASPP